MTKISRITRSLSEIVRNTLLLGCVAGLPLFIGNIRCSPINGASMEPTAHTNDIASWLPKLFTDLERNDVIVFNPPDLERKTETYVKRIVYLPGETFTNEKGQSITLGQGEYWVLGDNYSISRDSREFGPINHKDILGEVLSIYHMPDCSK